MPVALRAIAASSLLVTLVASGRVARAQDADACIAASESSLSLRKAGKLIDARKALATCAAPACPDPVKSSCMQRLADADRAVPSLVFQVKDTGGNDVPGVRISMDGQPLAERGVGTAFALDPGEHAFTFEAEGQPIARKTFVVVEGVKGRSELVVLGTPAPAPAAPAAPTAPVPASGSGSGGAQRTIGLVVGGVGIAGLAVGTVAGLLASTKWNTAQSECGPSVCPQPSQAQADQKGASSLATVSTVGFVAGGVVLAAGALLWFTAPSGDATPSSAWAIAPSATPGGGGILVRGGF